MIHQPLSPDGSVFTKIFEWGFLYLLVGKVGGTKHGTEVKEFLIPILISSSIKMEHYSVFLGAHKRWESTANMRRYFLPMYSRTVYPNHLTNF